MKTLAILMFALFTGKTFAAPKAKMFLVETKDKLKHESGNDYSDDEEEDSTTAEAGENTTDANDEEAAYSSPDYGYVDSNEKMDDIENKTEKDDLDPDHKKDEKGNNKASQDQEYDHDDNKDYDTKKEDIDQVSNNNKNADGNDKIPMMVIDTFYNPDALKGDKAEDIDSKYYSKLKNHGNDYIVV